MNIISQINTKRLPLHEYIPLSTPFVVHVEPSSYCNLKCLFCFHGSKNISIQKDIMSIDVFKTIINNVIEFPNRLKVLRFCGDGEPLMNKNILYFLQLLSNYNITEKIELITNGVLLNDELIKNLPKHLNRIVISIEGLSKRDYKQICDTNINFNKLINNINKLYHNKQNCIIHIKTQTAAIKTERDKNLFFELFNNMCDEICIENIVPMWPQLKIDLPSSFFRWEQTKTKQFKVCPQIFKSLQVHSNGDVLGCVADYNRLNILGNIKQTTLYNIWNGEKLKKIRTEHLNNTKNKMQPCNVCCFNETCELDNIDDYVEKCKLAIKGN